MKMKQVQKRILVTLSCLILVLSCSISQAMADSGIPLTVGVPTDRCPVFYIDAGTGEIVGIGVVHDLLEFPAEIGNADIVLLRKGF